MIALPSTLTPAAEREFSAAYPNPNNKEPPKPPIAP